MGRKVAIFTKKNIMMFSMYTILLLQNQKWQVVLISYDMFYSKQPFRELFFIDVHLQN